FRAAGDLATEIEWAKNRRLSPDDYADSLDGHEPPIPVDLMSSVFRRYEDGKNQRGLMDFEDLLERTIRMFQEEPWAREEFAARYQAFTVDEYQDVNLLQETLLREWLGGRDDLCVVGDDYQSIYGFTGATPRHLLEMPGRFANTNVIRLESNYRSTPQILDVANRLVPSLGGAEKVLQPTRPAGDEPALRSFKSGRSELSFIVGRIRSLQADGVPLENMAVLYRVNFRSEDFEEALAAEGIPYQVKDGAFLSRTTARQMLSVLTRSRSTAVVAEVRKLAERAGYIEDPPDDLGEKELTRQKDMARFIGLAEEFGDDTRTCAQFAVDIHARFGTEGEGRGINLMTLHRAKGLEFDAVFLPRVETGELPFKRSRSPEAVVEERRLFYVGITRAKTHLCISWVSDGKRKPSPFLTELGAGGAPLSVGDRSRRRTPREPHHAAAVGMTMALSGGFRGEIQSIEENGVTVRLDGEGEMTVDFGERVAVGGRTLPLGPPEAAGDGLLEELKRWRRKRARSDGVPAYVVFHDATLDEVARRKPQSLDDLADIAGIGPTKLERYGTEVIEACRTQ
ncbi:MAG: ATP-dependent DNA helicase UvrD2, partial [Actinomycetota bacterium]|nr:ATP-dependent DNA helicase UvrD2 [Actinomycetota bacterium]